MSIVDKMLGAVTPPESEEQRAEATRRARQAAQPGGWLELVLDHHDMIRRAFEQCRQAQSPTDRVASMKSLALLLNGHSLAEEVVIYPALAKAGHKAHAMEAYTEQTTAKMQMAELERIDPSTPEWMDKLEHIRGAVLHHVYGEEKDWFVDLARDGMDERMIARRYLEEFDRYAGREMSAAMGDGAGRSADPGGRDLDEPRSYV
jgi:hypothetical protein